MTANDVIEYDYARDMNMGFVTEFFTLIWVAKWGSSIIIEGRIAYIKTFIEIIESYAINIVTG